MARFDIAIIGTGPAGLQAALTAKARNKTILLIGSARLSDKVRKPRSVKNYLGLPNITGTAMQQTFLTQLADMDINITDEKATLVFPQEGFFSIQTDRGYYEAKTVIVATGMAPATTYPGEDEFLGRGVSYCATCDAALYRGRTAAVIASSPATESEVNFLAEFADEVLYFPLYAGEVTLDANVEIHHEIPRKITGNMKADTLETDGGIYHPDGIFVLRESVSPGRLVPTLEMDGNHIKVDRSMKTNIEGLFAAGDVTGMPYQYIKSAGEGSVAALSAAALLDARKRGAQKQSS